MHAKFSAFIDVHFRKRKVWMHQQKKRMRVGYSGMEMGGLSSNIMACVKETWLASQPGHQLSPQAGGPAPRRGT